MLAIVIAALIGALLTIATFGLIGAISQLISDLKDG